MPRQWWWEQPMDFDQIDPPGIDLDVPPAATPHTAGPTATAGAADLAGLSRREHLPYLEAIHERTAGGLSAGEAVRLLSVRLPMIELNRLVSRAGIEPQTFIAQHTLQ